MRGTFGTFTFFTDSPAEQRRDVSGGVIVPVVMDGDRALLTVKGPANPYRRDGTRFSVTLTVDVDPFEDAARFRVQAQDFILRSGEWSAWVTRGMPEDTSAYRQNVLDREEYLTQAQDVAREQIEMLKAELTGFRDGLLFIHLSGVDQNSHMLWGKFDGDLL